MKSLIKQQKGYLLITSLMLLVMLTVLGLAQVSINTTQTQIVTNTVDAEISFEKTEGAVNQAINQLLANNYSSFNFLNNANGLYIFNVNADPVWRTVNWDSSTTVINSFSGIDGRQAKYLIEQLPSVVQPGQNMKSLTRIYRITGRAVGQNGASSILIQSTVQVRN